MESTERPTFRTILSRWLNVDEATLDADNLKAGIERFLPEVEKLRPAGLGDDEELGLTMEEMIKESGLDEKTFHEVYLSWVEGRSLS